MIIATDVGHLHDIESILHTDDGDDGDDDNN